MKLHHIFHRIYSFYSSGKDQEERTRAIEQFRSHEKDVLVATDVASKGLDFPQIQHVINYDMPEDIENYGMNIFVFSNQLIPRVPIYSTPSSGQGLKNGDTH